MDELNPTATATPTPPPPTPTDWTKIALALIGFAGLAYQQQCNHAETKSGQLENRAVMREVQTKADDTHAAVTAVGTKLGAVPNK